MEELKPYKKLALVVLDGFGVASNSHGNAVSQASPEVFDFIISNYPSLTLQASGPLVGLPWGEMGNSEVGHLNIGAGRIVGQDLPRINSAIQDSSFFKNPVFLSACEHANKNNSKLHLVGMVSPGGVHSSDEHLFALLALAAGEKVEHVYIHMFTDGRDTGEKVALDALQKLRMKIVQIGVGKIATVTGRFYGMDRGKHWNQTEMTFQAMVNGIGPNALSAEDCILNNYQQSVYDEMIPPTVMVEPVENSSETTPVGLIANNDAIIFFNFRSDRALQLTQAFVKPEAMEIESQHKSLENVYVATMTEYFFGLPVHVAFPTQNLQNNLAEIISKNGLNQFHIAESEKYAHVTSFFNGGVNTQFPGEDRIIVKSPSNSNNYVDHPEMSGKELTEILVDKILNTDTNLFVANFANADMVGHTGNLQAAIKAVQALNRFIAKIMEACLQVDAALIITADHGNIEQMLNIKTGEIDKDHTTNPVPFLLIGKQFRFTQPQDGSYLALSARTPAGVISDIAPTILALLDIPQPREMDGINLLTVIDQYNLVT